VKIATTTSLLCLKNERQQSVKDFWLSIIANARAALRRLAIIDYRLPFKAKSVATTLLLCLKSERQLSVNDFWLCMIENARAVWQHKCIIALLAAFLGETYSDNIASMS